MLPQRPPCEVKYDLSYLPITGMAEVVEEVQTEDPEIRIYKNVDIHSLLTIFSFLLHQCMLYVFGKLTPSVFRIYYDV